MSTGPDDLLDDLLGDLHVEGDALREAVAGLDADGWATPTPAPGWSVAAQVAHLAWTDEAAILAARAGTPAGRAAWDDFARATMAAGDDAIDTIAQRGGAAPAAELLARWDSSRAGLGAALRAVPPGERLPWFGPPMSPTSMATARFMETWAHALDVRDALGLASAPTDRIRHVAHLGVRTRDFAYSVHGQPPPAEPFRVELTAPSGASWAWGPEQAEQSVRGPAYDFCLLVTQRVHRDDTALETTGADAAHWLRIAQAFAGAAGTGRERGSRG